MAHVKPYRSGHCAEGRHALGGGRVPSSTAVPLVSLAECTAYQQQREQLVALVTEYEDIFSTSGK